MTLEVLLSTMHQQNMDIVSSCNIKTDTVIVNQCEEDNCVCEQRDGQRIKWINSSERGLSKSRNMALASSGADICLLCDEDVKYYNNYEKIVKKAFKKLPQADVIIFDIDEVGNIDKRKKATVISKVPFYKTFGSVHIAFKRNVIIKKNIRFNENFGAGSGKYAMAEDALLFREFTKKRLKVYRYPATISKVAFEGSTWFEGFTERYFYDTGAYLKAAYPKMCHLLKWYYPIRLKRKSKLTIIKMIKAINLGIYGYEKLLSFSEMMERKNAK